MYKMNKLEYINYKIKHVNCSCCRKYDRTRKICKADNSTIIGNTHLQTNCKNYSFDGNFFDNGKRINKFTL